MPAKSTYTKDAKQPGLFLRTDENTDGSKLIRWCYRKQHRTAGKSHRVYLTCPLSYRPASLTDARQWAKTIAAKVELGQPIHEQQQRLSTAKKRGANVAITTDMTLAELLTAYCQGKTKSTRDRKTVNLSERYVKDVMRLVQAPLTRLDIMKRIAAGETGLSTRQVKGPGTLFHLAHKRLSAIHAQDLSTWYHDTLAKSPVAAGHDAAIIKAALTWVKFPAERNPFLPSHPLYVPLQKPGIDKARLWSSDLKSFWQAIESVGVKYPDHQAYLKLMILTAKRPAELLQCTAADFNKKAKTLHLNKMKSRVAHTIFLSRQAAQIIEVQARGKKGDDKLFPTIGDNALLIEKINAQLGTDYTPKDLRKVSATVAAEVLPIHRVQALMDHAPTTTLTQHYVNSDQEAQKGWQILADEIERIVN